MENLKHVDPDWCRKQTWRRGDACREQQGYRGGRDSQGMDSNRRRCPVGSDEDTVVSQPMSTRREQLSKDQTRWQILVDTRGNR